MAAGNAGFDRGQWEADVIGSNRALLTLRWLDYNALMIVSRRNELARLPALGG